MNKFTFTSLLAIAVISPEVDGPEFCVTTSAELKNALDLADENNQGHLIKIAQGDYIPLTECFIYSG